MAKRTRRVKKEDVVIDVEQNEEAERREVYLERIKAEDKANEKTYKKSGSFISIHGHKVLLRYKNAAGSIYTRYWFNAKKHPTKIGKIKKDGGCEIDGEFLKLEK